MNEPPTELDEFLDWLRDWAGRIHAGGAEGRVVSGTTELERRVALAIAKIYTDDGRAELHARHLIPHARAAIAEVLDHIFSPPPPEPDADASAQPS